MAYICPVCNGLSSLQAICTSCSHQLDDYGRIDQMWGPYSPYREIDDLKLTNGFIDLETHNCTHLASCPTCGKDQIVSVKEEFQA